MKQLKRKKCLIYVDDTDIKCGENENGISKVYCANCLEWNRSRFPQGWVHYAGDTCKHSEYVGGVGIDYMCGRCEDGDI